MEKLHRNSGLLMHITSLPNSYGLGTFSCECEKFVDWLQAGGFRTWQMLPLADSGYGLSPYSAESSFAINPYLIDLTGFLSHEDLEAIGFSKSNTLAQQKQCYDLALGKIYETEGKKYNRAKWEKDNAYWLDDYALYKAIKVESHGKPWTEWKSGLKNRIKTELELFRLTHTKLIDKFKFIQYIASTQWGRVKSYANSKGIDIFGDIPMYVELDSADVWSNPKNWQLEQGKPKLVSGVPPDDFNADGQLWGQPLYNYTSMSKRGYDFWVKRFRRLEKLYDIIRIDHFVAFSRYWAIPSNAKSAKDGKWVKGSGKQILKILLSKFKVRVVAEDLGNLADDVRELRDHYKITGTKVMQFAFESDGDNEYQPHNYDKNCVAYLGTHDNDTFMGLMNDGNWDRINRFKRYLNIPLEWGNDAVLDNAILALYRSSANLIVLTAQDVLKYGSEARMNIPGVPEGNWTWQLEYPLDMALAERYKYLSTLYAR